jgi:hypothetical protein
MTAMATLASSVAAVVSVYFAWQTVALSIDASEAQRRAGRPYLRLQRMNLEDRAPRPGIDFSAAPGVEMKLTSGGQPKQVVLEFANSGQRPASGIHAMVEAHTTASLDKGPGPRPPDEFPWEGASVVACPGSIANDIAPGEPFDVGCPVVLPRHEWIGVRILYTDLEDAEEFCQFLALRVTKDGSVRHADQIAALSIARPDAKCGPREPAWLQRARIPPNSTGSPFGEALR